MSARCTNLAWLANAKSQTSTGVPFAEARMAQFINREVLLVDINGGVNGVVDGLEVAMNALDADLLVGLDVGGDSLGLWRGTGTAQSAC